MKKNITFTTVQASRNKREDFKEHSCNTHICGHKLLDGIGMTFGFPGMQLKAKKQHPCFTTLRSLNPEYIIIVIIMIIIIINVIIIITIIYCVCVYLIVHVRIWRNHETLIYLSLILETS